MDDVVSRNVEEFFERSQIRKPVGMGNELDEKTEPGDANINFWGNAQDCERDVKREFKNLLHHAVPERDGEIEFIALMVGRMKSPSDLCDVSHAVSPVVQKIPKKQSKYRSYGETNGAETVEIQDRPVFINQEIDEVLSCPANQEDDLIHDT